jgi:hypothetical protein
MVIVARPQIASATFADIRKAAATALHSLGGRVATA